MRKSLGFAGILLCLAAQSWAVDAMVFYGTVTDSSGNPVPNIPVYYDANNYDSTSADGAYIFKMTGVNYPTIKVGNPLLTSSIIFRSATNDGTDDSIKIDFKIKVAVQTTGDSIRIFGKIQNKRNIVLPNIVVVALLRPSAGFGGDTILDTTNSLGEYLFYGKNTNKRDIIALSALPSGGYIATSASSYTIPKVTDGVTDVYEKNFILSHIDTLIINGVVTDSATGDSLSNAAVVLRIPGIGQPYILNTTTGPKGLFTFGLLPIDQENFASGFESKWEISRTDFRMLTDSSKFTYDGRDGVNDTLTMSFKLSSGVLIKKIVDTLSLRILDNKDSTLTAAKVEIRFKSGSAILFDTTGGSTTLSISPPFNFSALYRFDQPAESIWVYYRVTKQYYDTLLDSAKISNADGMIIKDTLYLKMQTVGVARNHMRLASGLTSIFTRPVQVKVFGIDGRVVQSFVARSSRDLFNMTRNLEQQSGRRILFMRWTENGAIQTKRIGVRVR